MRSFLILLVVTLSIHSGFSQTNETSVTEYIKAESVGGKLDFKKILKEEGKEKQLFLVDKIAYNSNDYSVLLWGVAVKKLGITSVKDAMMIWKSINSSNLSIAEQKALKKGFKMKLE